MENDLLHQVCESRDEVTRERAAETSPNNNETSRRISDSCGDRSVSQYAYGRNGRRDAERESVEKSPEGAALLALQAD